MKIPTSIRWRLPLSYAAIALLAAVALGAILLPILRNFYFQQEQLYLLNNAQTVSREIAPVLLADLPVAALASQVEGFAFLSQTRIKVFDNEDVILADTKSLTAENSNINIEIGVSNEEINQTFNQALSTDESGTGNVTTTIVIEEETRGGIFSREVRETVIVADEELLPEALALAETEVEEPQGLPFLTVGNLFGFALEGTAVSSERSHVIVSVPVVDLLSGTQIGRVELSEGPAYGRSILRSVAWGWAIASVAAVLVAAAIGWLVSRRLTAPLLSLTAVTAQMAAGDLAVRSDVQRQDELGSLGRAFNSMAAQIEETVTTLQAFVADAAHELHTPLTALQTDLELMAQSASSGNADRIARAQAQVTRLTALADSLLDLSRIEAGTAVTPFAPIDLRQLVQESGERYASRAEQAGLTFTLTLPSQPLRVRGDAQQLTQAVGNLLDNAIKFTPAAGSVTLALAEMGETAVITVSDSGIGIPEAEMGLLYGRFHRGRNASNYPGSGLGLAIVQAIMRRHQGQVTATRQQPGLRMQLIFRVADS